MTTYLPVVGFEGYRVGSDGSVWSRWIKRGLGRGKGSCRILGDEWKLMKTTPNRGGRHTVGLGDYATYLVARIVLTAFAGPCPDGMEACHRNGIRHDDRIDNLRWDTPKNNDCRKVKRGIGRNGSKNGMSKFTDADIIKIRQMYSTGLYNQSHLAAIYKTSQTTISLIVTRRSWKHI